MSLFKKRNKLDSDFLRGLVSGFCQAPNGRWSTSLYPPNMNLENQAFTIGDHIGGFLKGEDKPGYIDNGEFMKWLITNMPDYIIRK